MPGESAYYTVEHSPAWNSGYHVLVGISLQSKLLPHKPVNHAAVLIK